MNFRFILVFALAIFLVSSPVSVFATEGYGGPLPQCSDGLDNDGDSVIDQADPGCHGDNIATNPLSYIPSNNSEIDHPSTPGGGGGGGGGGGNGPISASFGAIFGSTAGGGQVLGASTSNPAPTLSCSPLLSTYMRQGRTNNVNEVKALQTFLNSEMNSGLPVTGYFGSLTTAAVKAFQSKYASEVLTPWGLTAPTGFVYKSTQWKINMIHCTALRTPFPVLN